MRNGAWLRLDRGAKKAELETNANPVQKEAAREKTTLTNCVRTSLKHSHTNHRQLGQLLRADLPQSIVADIFAIPEETFFRLH